MVFKWFKKKKEIDEVTENADIEIEKNNDEIPDNNDIEIEKTADEVIEKIDLDSEKKNADEVKTDLPDETYDEEQEDKKTEQEKEDLPGEIKEEPQSEEKKSRKSLFGRLKQGLSKTRTILTTDINDLFTGKTKIDDDFFEDLEELLITSDIGVKATTDLIQIISKKSSKISDSEQLKEILKEEIFLLLDKHTQDLEKPIEKPHVVMVIGVNGTGKTTTIGKLALKATAKGKKVLMVAADTFRAAAVEQLMIWADRAGADIVKHKENSDPAAVAYDGIDASLARNSDIVLIDTAGRLHTKSNLMEELKKIKRSIAKKIPDAPHEILLVLDATTGQNALSQAKTFDDALDITGIVLTKLDGTAKGGIVASICSTLNIPIKYIGIGEKIEDLQKFDPKQFIAAIFE